MSEFLWPCHSAAAPHPGPCLSRVSVRRPPFLVSARLACVVFIVLQRPPLRPTPSLYQELIFGNPDCTNIDYEISPVNKYCPCH